MQVHLRTEDLVDLIFTWSSWRLTAFLIYIRSFRTNQRKVIENMVSLILSPDSGLSTLRSIIDDKSKAAFNGDMRLPFR
jgi:hypothetical protein